MVEDLLGNIFCTPKIDHLGLLLHGANKPTLRRLTPKRGYAPGQTIQVPTSTTPIRSPTHLYPISELIFWPRSTLTCLKRFFEHEFKVLAIGAQAFLKEMNEQVIVWMARQYWQHSKALGRVHPPFPYSVNGCQ